MNVFQCLLHSLQCSLDTSGSCFPRLLYNCIDTLGTHLPLTLVDAHIDVGIPFSSPSPLTLRTLSLLFGTLALLLCFTLCTLPLLFSTTTLLLGLALGAMSLFFRRRKIVGNVRTKRCSSFGNSRLNITPKFAHFAAPVTPKLTPISTKIVPIVAKVVPVASIFALATAA